MKFLALVLGIKHANADRPCPWCLSSRKEFPVNIHDHKSFRVLEGERPEELGYKKDPIFKFVKMENIIVDILHLFLRVADKLLDVLYQYIEQLDWIAQQEKMEENKKKKERGEVIEEEEQEEDEDDEQKGEKAMEEKKNKKKKNKKKNGENLLSYVKFLESIKIKKPCDLDINPIKFRNFSGDEQIKIFQNINFTRLFPKMEKANVMQSTWDEFYDIIYDSKDNNITIMDIKTRTFNFYKNFRQLCFDKTIPYIHIFISHLFQQVEYLKTKNLVINDFSMQGIEKLNDSVTKYFQRSTNKKKNYLCQILQKRSRVEILKHHNNLNLLLN